MKPLAGHKVVAAGAMAGRPLARFLASLGADLVTGGGGELAGASFLIDDVGADGFAEAGWPRARIEQLYPALVHVSVTPFGSGGPRGGWKGGELVASAMGGALRLTGQPDRRPVKEALDACTFHADMAAAAGAMAASLERARSGRGQHVDVSIQEVAFSRNVNGILSWQFDRRKLHRAGGALNYGRATVRCIWALADGWCFHSLMTGRFGAPANQALSDWIDEARLPNPLRGVDWLSYNRSTLDPEIRAQWEAAIADFFATRTRAEVGTEGRRRGINACVVAEPRDVLGDPHLEARGFWTEAEGLRLPGRFVSLREATAAAPVRDIAPSDRPGPLSGLRVLDFSWALVGSITTKTLGDLGADVVKVESRTRPCLSRLDVQVSASRPGNFDDKPWFAHLNTSKRSLALDMKKPEARALLRPLVEWADIVVENFSPGTMAKLGLDYDSLAAINPAIVMVSGSVFGQTGPLAEEWGVDGTGGALSGRTFLTGWPDRDPVIPGAVPYGDVIVPFVMAAAAAAAIEHRGRTGRGGHVDASMYEICVQQMHDAFVAEQRGERPTRMGNADPVVHHQDLYPAAGEDRWVAITLPTAEDEARLKSVTGDDVAAWTSQRSDREAAEILQAAGIMAGAVQDIEDLIEADPQLGARGALVELDHELLGRFGHVRTPIDFSRDTVAPFRPPSLGEHSVEIATGLAGLSPEQARALQQTGLFQ
ncbi:CaiB/BaiF CoA-transferase family protein [Sphingosinicella terrae]|uniref:CaiB/BaiF CoA-transferase family protein n=1 Tax=Sphingosinicella terrae TaxID=2172047 RepID=UPI000E0D8DB4|nr:CoA transferase [Sphingosinicella terrae]